jgi:hypothetical protein
MEEGYKAEQRPVGNKCIDKIDFGVFDRVFYDLLREKFQEHRL